MKVLKKRVCGITDINDETVLVLEPEPAGGPGYVRLTELADTSAGSDKYRLARLYIGRVVSAVSLGNSYYSIKRAVEHLEPKLKDEVLANPDKEYDVTVVRVSRSGAEVEIDETLRCWLPVTEYQHEWTENLQLVCPLRSKFKVKIINPCDDQGRIVVSRKALLPDPWNGASKKYRPGTVWLGILRSVLKSGVLVELEPGITARCSMPRKWNPQINAEVTVEIEGVSPESRRMKGRIIWAEFAFD